LEKGHSSESSLTISEAIFYFSQVFNRDKYDRARKFVRTGMNRRQDHGSRGLYRGHTWDDRERDFTQAAKRRDFRAAGR